MDERDLRKLYDALVNEEYYTKTFVEFKNQFAEPSYQERVFKVVSDDELFTLGRDAFYQKYTGGPAPALPQAIVPQQQEQVEEQVVAEPVKKKEEQQLPPWLQEQQKEDMPFLQYQKEEELSPFLESMQQGGSSVFQKPAPLTPEQIAQVEQRPQEQVEKDFFTGAFGDALRKFDEYSPIGFGDFIDDSVNAIVQGYYQGQLGAEADRLLLQGTKPTPEQIEKFLKALEKTKGMAPSQEMMDYQRIYEENGKGFWGVVSGLMQNPSVASQVIYSSLSSMFTNPDASGLC